jgi:hypothetical protein
LGGPERDGLGAEDGAGAGGRHTGLAHEPDADVAEEGVPSRVRRRWAAVADGAGLEGADWLGAAGQNSVLSRRAHEKTMVERDRHQPGRSRRETPFAASRQLWVQIGASVRAKSGGGRRRLRRWRTDDQQGNLMPRWWGSHSLAGEPFPSVASLPCIVPPCSVAMASESCSCNNEVSPSLCQDLQLVLYDWKDGHLISGDPVIWSFGLWYF